MNLKNVNGKLILLWILQRFLTGKGSYGAVYKARDLRTSELVAIKVISLCEGVSILNINHIISRHSLHIFMSKLALLLPNYWNYLSLFEMNTQSIIMVIFYSLNVRI